MPRYCPCLGMRRSAGSGKLAMVIGADIGEGSGQARVMVEHGLGLDLDQDHGQDEGAGRLGLDDGLVLGVAGRSGEFSRAWHRLAEAPHPPISSGSYTL